MDQALLTRMMHCTMEFQASAWAAWAERTGIDARGISFVLAYPELVGKGRTTPRSLTFLFEHLRGIDDVAAHAALVNLLAHSCIEPEAAVAFVGYLNSSMAQLPSPQELLANDLAGEIFPRLARVAFDQSGAPRIDHLSVLVERLLAHARSRTSPLDERARGNLVAFLMWDRLPREVVRMAWLAGRDIEHLRFLGQVDRLALRA
jgi:hypothetical protein